MSRMLVANGVKIGLLLSSLYAGMASAATLVIVNSDGPGEGFNDPTPVQPVGGNPGTTLGEQRLEVFRYAAQVWGERLNSDVVIEVEAKFDPLSCNAFSAVLGSAGTTTLHRDFANAPQPTTWYPQALANALAGTDLSARNPDLGATFNSSIDNNNNCLTGMNWYLGLDGNNGSDIDLADVVMHEIGHGVGFASYVNDSTGELFFGYMDIFSSFLEDHSLAKTWPLMSDSQRQASAIDTQDLHFVGSNLVAETQSHVSMYAPNPVEPGSSVSHFDTSQNQLMEPFITNPPRHDPGLAFQVMKDLGWTTTLDNRLPTISIGAPANGSTFDVGEIVTFTGSANDPEDGDLTAAITWTSSLDGVLGAASPLSTASLTLGTHTISATVTDSNGGSANAEVTIEIQDPLLTAPNAPSNVQATLLEGVPHIEWVDNSHNEESQAISRETKHKKRDTYVGSTELGSVPADVTSFDDITADPGTYRYCVRAINAAGTSASTCSAPFTLEGSTSDGGGGGKKDCTANPDHPRCR